MAAVIQIQHVVMINCGATIDVVEVLQPDDNICFYICDRYGFIALCTLNQKHSPICNIW